VLFLCNDLIEKTIQQQPLAAIICNCKKLLQHWKTSLWPFLTRSSV